MIVLKSEAEIARMRAAGRIVARALREVAAAAEPGVRLDELDTLAAQVISAAGAKSSFLGYHPSWAPTPYPATVCLSVNDAIVHGIPGRTKLRAGDLLSIDCGAELDGYHGDAAITIGVGAIDESAQRLLDTTRDALAAGIAAATAGHRIGDISHAVETLARAAGYGLADGMGGHGIGTAMHEDPPVPNAGRPGRGRPLTTGLALAIEPMLTEGGSDHTRTLRDGWTIATVDGRRAAHFEHTIAITPDGPEILTTE